MPGSWREDRRLLSTSDTAGLTLSCQWAQLVGTHTWWGAPRKGMGGSPRAHLQQHSTPQTQTLSTPGHCCMDEEGGEMVAMLLLPLPTSSQGYSYPPQGLGREETPRMEMGIKIPLPMATRLQGQLSARCPPPAPLHPPATLTPTTSCIKCCFLPSPSSLSYKRVDYPEIGRDGSLQPKSPVPARRSDSALSNHGPSPQL